MNEENINLKEIFKPNDTVKCCKELEKGCCFQLWGLTACCHGTHLSPTLISTEEITDKKVNYELIVQRKKELFLGINGKKDMDLGGCKGCTKLVEKKFKDVNFDYLGGEYLAGAFNIQHYTTCNEKCSYCCYAQENNFKKPQYNILEIWEMFRKKGKLKGNNWIDFSGGEPTLLKNFDEIIKYIMKYNLGKLVVYSNSTIYSPLIYEGLKKNKIILTTSVDTGLKSTYKNLRGLDAYDKVFSNLIKYRNSKTKGLWLKYVVTEENRTDDDMYSFLSLMLALRPNQVQIAADFPYGDKQIPKETIEFAAKLWYLVEKYLGKIVFLNSTPYGDPKFKKYHKDLELELNRLKKENPIKKDDILIVNKLQSYAFSNFLRKIATLIPDTPFLAKIKEKVRNLFMSLGIF